MRTKKVLIGGAAIVVILGIIAGYFLLRDHQENGIKYKTEILSKGNIEALVSTTGTVNPVTIVEVGSQVSGRILKLYVDFNTRVKEGQVVAEIDPSQILTQIKQYEANYESAKASLEKAKVTLENIRKQYDRALQLFKKELISFEEKESTEAQFLTAKTDVQSAQARLQQSKSQLDSAKVDLGYTVIKSPIDGIVILRNVNIGQTVAASFQAPVLFKIANDLSKMQVECSIDEADIGKIKEGQEVKFTVDAFPEENFNGKVTQVRYSPEVIQNVVTYTTIVEVANPEMKLRPGMTATVSIVTGRAENALLVPNAALRFTPTLSPEEMKEIMMHMREEMTKRRGGERPDMEAGSERRSQFPGMRMAAGGKETEGSSRRKQAPRVWILDETGKLRLAFFKAGVTDDSYTEVVRGTLKEGQRVITGITSGDNKKGSDSEQMGRPPRMMFPR